MNELKKETADQKRRAAINIEVINSRLAIEKVFKLNNVNPAELDKMFSRYTSALRTQLEVKMGDKMLLAIIGMIFTIIIVYVASVQRGKIDQQQLARIEVNGLNINAKMDEVEGEINLIKKTQANRKNFVLNMKILLKISSNLKQNKL